MRRAMAQTALDVKLRWSFEVVRGRVSEELLAATESVGLVTLGRVGRSPFLYVKILPSWQWKVGSTFLRVLERYAEHMRSRYR